MPTVSVIIPAYNAEDYIAETLDSALAQTYSDHEILVIDDGSTDSTVEILTRYRDRIRLHRKPNGGPASARNLGLAHARGKYVAFLDSDDLWHPEKLKRQVELMERRPEVGLVHTARIYFEDGHPERQMLRRVALEDRNADGFARLFRRNFIGNSTVLARQECFEKIGGFNESSDFLGTEDYEMWLRIAHDYPIAYLDEPLSSYRLRNGQLSSKIERAYRNEKHVIEEAVRLFPDLEERIDISVSERLAQLAFEYGRDYWVARDFRSARRKFATALQHAVQLRPLLYYLMTFAAARFVRA